MFLFTTWALRLLGICGIAGSLLFICGDLLYNHSPGSPKSPATKMSKMPESRLLSAGVLGLGGCWLYALASLHVFIAFRPAGEPFAFLLTLAFASVMISYGIAHTAYFSIAAGAKVADQLGSDAELGGKLGNTFFRRLVFITYVPVAIASVMMFYGILAGGSLYPRWMILFLPIIIYLLKTPITRIFRGQLREFINDAYDNVVLLGFFLLSTLVLWNAVVA